MSAIDKEGTIHCPNCYSTDLDGDTGDQVPHCVGYPGESEYEVAYYEWVDFTCKDCGHQWRDENETTPAEEMKELGVPGLFD